MSTFAERVASWTDASTLHVGSEDVYELKERGAKRTFEQRDPFTSGPLASRLDAAGIALRVQHWNLPCVGDAELQAILPTEGAVIAWGYGVPRDHLRRAWTRSVVDRCAPHLPVHRGHFPRLHPEPHVGDIELQTDDLVHMDHLIWQAATSDSPHRLLDLREQLPAVADALFHWYPRVHSGLCRWEHEILENVDPSLSFVYLVGHLLKENLFEIGDCTLVGLTSELVATGLIRLDNADDDWPRWRLERTAAGDACLAGDAPCWSTAEKRGQVGGVALCQKGRVWALDAPYPTLVRMALPPS